MKFLVCLVAFFALSSAVEKKDKRGLLDLGYGGGLDYNHYGHHGGAVLAEPLSLPLASYDHGLSYGHHGLDYHSTPILTKSYAAPIVAKSYVAAPVLTKSYAAPILTKSYAAPILTKSYAAPIASPIIKSYAAPVLAKSYVAAPSYVASPISYGHGLEYSSGVHLGYGGYGDLGYGKYIH